MDDSAPDNIDHDLIIDDVSYNGPDEDEHFGEAVSEQEDSEAPAASFEKIAVSPNRKSKPPLVISKAGQLKRTFIPILFTVGFLMIVTGIIELLMPPDNPLAAPARWIPYALFVVALILFAMAALNMLQVRDELVLPVAQSPATEMPTEH